MRAVTDQDVRDAKSAVVHDKREKQIHALKVASHALTATWLVETVVLEALACAALVRWLRS